MNSPLAVLKAVLVVDDEPLIAMLLEDMLGDLGVETVVTAGDTTSAENAIIQTHFDCVILDVNIRGVESYPFADFLVGQAIPLLFSTGVGPEAMVERFKGIPALQKPFGEAELRKALVAAIQQQGRGAR